MTAKVKARRKRELSEGTRIRLKTRSLFGWKGTGTVMRQSFDSVLFMKDDTGETCEALRDQVAVVRAHQELTC